MRTDAHLAGEVDALRHGDRRSRSRGRSGRRRERCCSLYPGPDEEHGEGKREHFLTRERKMSLGCAKGIRAIANVATLLRRATTAAKQTNTEKAKSITVSGTTS